MTQRGVTAIHAVEVVLKPIFCIIIAAIDWMRGIGVGSTLDAGIWMVLRTLVQMAHFLGALLVARRGRRRTLGSVAAVAAVEVGFEP